MTIPPFRRVVAAFTLALLGAACDGGGVYPTTFICGDPGGPSCPALTVCPTVPLGPDSCGDLPGLFGHLPVSVDSGRPVGCVVGLSYGNPYYGNSQQSCTCTAGSPTATWLCPI